MKRIFAILLVLITLITVAECAGEKKRVRTKYVDKD